MSTIEVVIVAAIVIAFVIFAAVLAWADSQTRHLPPLASQGDGKTRQGH